jgi:hypothetical protein
MVKRRVFKYKEKVAVRWRKLHNKELYNLYYSPNIVKVVKLRMIAEDERILLKRILKK